MSRTLEEWGKDYTYAVNACRQCLTDTPQSVLVDMKGFDYWAKRVQELTKEFREWRSDVLPKPSKEDKIKVRY